MSESIRITKKEDLKVGMEFECIIHSSRGIFKINKGVLLADSDHIDFYLCQNEIDGAEPPYGLSIVKGYKYSWITRNPFNDSSISNFKIISTDNAGLNVVEDTEIIEDNKQTIDFEKIKLESYRSELQRMFTRRIEAAVLALANNVQITEEERVQEAKRAIDEIILIRDEYIKNFVNKEK